MKQLAIVSGGFDPLHPGHVSLIEDAARNRCGVLVVLNSDDWLSRKKGRPFMTWDDRAAILRGLKGVYDVVPVDDRDGTVCNAIYKLKSAYWDYDLVFCNGGDRVVGNTPEAALCDGLGIRVEWNVGGGKTNSSSHLLSKWGIEEDAHRDTVWGEWVVYRNFTSAKLKELTVRPGQRLSFQKHSKRSEFWFVARGQGAVLLYDQINYDIHPLKTGDTITVPAGTWHQLRNTGDEDLHVFEIQFGELCIEEDIERWPVPQSIRAADLSPEDLSLLKEQL